MCKVLNVSPSGHYAWGKRPVSAREMANRELVERIEAVYQESYGTYGSPRIYRELRAQGAPCSENRVARLMRLRGIRAKQAKRYKATSKANKAHPVAPNLLKGDFGADRPDQTWLADITYIPTREGWLYLAAILDLYTRRIVGWSMSKRMTSALTLAALKMALQRREPAAGVIHHSDQAGQYTDRGYQALLEAHGIQPSMNGVGSWYDNAPMESFIGTLKSEWVHHRQYHTRDEASPDLFFYIEGFYNRRRRHSSLGYLSPEAYEQLYYQRHEFRLSPCPQNQGNIKYHLPPANELSGIRELRKFILQEKKFANLVCAYVAAKLYPEEFSGDRMCKTLVKYLPGVKPAPKGKGTFLQALRVTKPPLIVRMFGESYRWNNDINASLAVQEMEQWIRRWKKDIPSAEMIETVRQGP